MKIRLRLLWKTGLILFGSLLPAYLLSCGTSNSTGGGATSSNTLAVSFVDGYGLNGINKDSHQSANNPQLTVFNSKLYAAWEEVKLNAFAVPTPIIGLSGVTAMASEGNHTCALISGGTAQCWGFNGNGELGNNSTQSSSTPVTVVTPVMLGSSITFIPLTGITAVSTGEKHTCALITGGSIQCWGNNSFGQLAMATTTAILSSTPVSISGLNGAAIAIAGGANHTCALITGGSVQCWGDNSNGQLGNNSNMNSPIPVSVNGLSGAVTAIAAGGNHTCALISGGTVQCWGDNSSGQLGNNSKTNSPFPVSVTGLSGAATTVTAGGNHTCALISGGTAQCWGDNSSGQLGNNSKTNSPFPVSVTGLSGAATTVTAGGSHTCALISGGTIQCWGNNHYVQLGNGNTAPVLTPLSVAGLSGVSLLSAGNNHTCALITGGSVQCWGDNSIGQLGSGNMLNLATQIRVVVFNGNISNPLWTAVDGNGINGINFDVTKNALHPQLAVFNAKLYATWQEFSGTASQIRMAVYNGNDNNPIWTFVEHFPTTINGINYNSTMSADLPKLTVLNNSKLYAAWEEFNGTTVQVRLAAYNGNDSSPSWTFVDGNALTGLSPQLTAMNSKLYATWQEVNDTTPQICATAQICKSTQIRTAVYNGNDSSPSWTFVEGAGLTGLNKDLSRNAFYPQLTVLGSSLYAAWEEYNKSSTQIRLAVYNGNDSAPSWSFVDGNGLNGINWDPAKNANFPQLTTLGSDLYATWQEFNGVATEIRLAKFNGNNVNPAWTFLDGNGTKGINYDSGSGANHPKLTPFNSKLYVSWEEYNFVSQIRVAVVP